MINKEKLYELKNGNLTIYTYNIETDIYNKTGINIVYDVIINIDANIYFFIQENISFRKLRSIKQYFLNNMPYCINVEFDDNYVNVILTRDHGLDSIKNF